MLTSAQMVAIVKEIDATYVDGCCPPVERADLVKYYSDDIELHLPYGAPAVTGIDQVLERILLEQSLFEHFEMEFKEPIVAGDTVVTCVSGTMRDRKTDDFVGFEAVEVSVFNPQGKISKKTLYLDLDSLEHAMGKQTLDNLIAEATQKIQAQ